MHRSLCEYFCESVLKIPFVSIGQVNGIINNLKGRKESYVVPYAKHTPCKENRTPTLTKTVEFISSLF
ncbi:hypothetical protein [Empedobacter tilapiae]